MPNNNKKRREDEYEIREYVRYARKLLRRVLNNVDSPADLKDGWSRGKYGVCWIGKRDGE